MEAQRARALEKQFEEEHEQQAREGWPGAWADRTVFDEVWESWSKDRRDALLAEGLKAFNQYLFSTADRYREYRRDAKTAEMEADRSDAWLRFLDDTARDRRIFRSTVFCKFLVLADD